jgi:uncharacterized membrane protein
VSVVLWVLLLGLTALVIVPEIVFLVRTYRANMAACLAGCQWHEKLFLAAVAAVAVVPLLFAVAGWLIGRRLKLAGRIACALAGVIVGGLFVFGVGLALLYYKLVTLGF